VPTERVAARFHAGVAAGTASACAALAGVVGLDTVALSGGVFQNRLLLEATTGALAREGLRVLRPERLPPNDGGIAYGQAVIAAANI
jgi:hydrogenase maturation protein HypF